MLSQSALPVLTLILKANKLVKMSMNHL